MDDVNTRRKDYVPYIAIAIVIVALAVVVYYVAFTGKARAGSTNGLASYGTNGSAGSSTNAIVASGTAGQPSSSLGVPSLSKYDNIPVPGNVLSLLNVPENISNTVGIGTAYKGAIAILGNRSMLTSDSKPEILYMGAEYCPYCAAERWAMVIALSRFGSFSNLHFMTSSASDYSPSTPTFTFYNSTYTSPYITFVGVEQTTNKLGPTGYVHLQQPTSGEFALQNEYNPNGSMPFILFANRSIDMGAMFDPYSVLYGKNWTTIAQEMYNTSSAQSQSIIGSADLLTEQICSADNDTPSSVCSQPYVAAIRQSLGS